jgi:hypothetical protein
MLRKLVVLAALAGCTAGPPLPSANPATLAPEAGPAEPLPFEAAWTGREGIAFLRGPGESTLVLRPFTRLRVLGREAGGWRVRCEVCIEPIEGILGDDDIVHTPLPPEVAAWGSLAEFALSIRAAAEAEQLELLLPVMIEDFTQSLIGPQTPAMALEVWRSENLTTLSQLPGLLDQGLSTRDTLLWTAPPAYTESFYYRGPRAGFRKRADGRWEWLFLIAGLRPND